MDMHINIGSYKERKYVNSGSNKSFKKKIFIKDNMNRIFFDGTNVVVDLINGYCG